MASKYLVTVVLLSVDDNGSDKDGDGDNDDDDDDDGSGMETCSVSAKESAGKVE